MTDYFTKWVEAEAYAKIKGIDVQKFVWKYIICRHGVLYEIVTDNRPNLTCKVFDDLCAKWKIRLSKSTPYYPQDNGQAESTNKTIIARLKNNLEKRKKSGRRTSTEFSGHTELHLGILRGKHFFPLTWSRSNDIF